MSCTFKATLYNARCELLAHEQIYNSPVAVPDLGESGAGVNRSPVEQIGICGTVRPNCDLNWSDIRRVFHNKLILGE